MDFTQFTFILKEDVDASIVSAYLQLFDLDSLWEEKGKIHAYFRSDSISTSKDNFITQLNSKVSKFVKEIIEVEIEKVNWNKKWESNFPTVQVDKFVYIYASFHEREKGFEHYIEIAPKMAFGTGHHETTFMMIQAMAKMDHTNKNVLDLGCGTGILAVLASKLAAKNVTAIDIEMPSYNNTIEHAEMNDVTIETYLGAVEDVPKRKYDIVLANINRNVLLSYKNEIIEFVIKGGELVLSGILKEDAELIKQAYGKLKLNEINNKGNWLCFHYSSIEKGI